MLRYIYTFDYISEFEVIEDWKFYVAVAEVANKYRVERLETVAINKLECLANGTTIDTAMDMLEHLQQNDYGKTDAMADVLDTLRDNHFAKLVKMPRFRVLLEADKETMWEYVERLSFANDLVEKGHPQCYKCAQGKVVGVLDEKRYPEAMCTTLGCGGVAEYLNKCWVKRD